MDRITYGDVVLEGFIPRRVIAEGRLLPLRLPPGLKSIENVEAVVGKVLSSTSDPEVPPLSTYLRTEYRGGIVSIVVDDYTRPNEHTKLILPNLLRHIRKMGVEQGRIRFIMACGTHRPPSEEEWAKCIGAEVWSAYRSNCEAHDCVKSVVKVGVAPDGVPVELNKTAAESEILIPLTDLDYHYFAGVAGGPKQLMPGISGKAIITSEHLRMFGKLGFADHVDAGILEGNPVFEYKLKVISVIEAYMKSKGGLIYAVTTVMSPDRRLMHIESGDVVRTHRRSKKVLDEVYIAKIPRLADVAIAGSRHYGINLYQAGKAINNAKRGVHEGGKIMVLAPCPDAWGNEEFRRLMGLAAPLLKEARATLQSGGGSDAFRRHVEDRMLAAVQEAVVKDFKIGKQKAVDLLVTLKHVGLGNLWMIQDGISPEDQESLPVEFEGTAGEDPRVRLARWIERQEAASRPTYIVVDDPVLMLSVED